MKCCAVVDTNVVVSALLSKKEDAATVQVFRAMLGGRFTPLYHEDILDEYEEVLHRPKFHLSEDVIRTVILAVKRYGIEVFPQPTGKITTGDVVSIPCIKFIYLPSGHYQVNADFLSKPMVSAFAS